MFVQEDPGKKKSPRTRFLQYSAIRSYAAAYQHSRRRLNVRDDISNGLITPALHPNPESTVEYQASNYGYSSTVGSASPTISHSARSSRSRISRINRRQFTGVRDKAVSRSRSLLRTLHPTHPEETFREARSIQFFVERTALEWSGWSDHHFWRYLVLQTSTIHPCIRHGLVSLAATHEALEMQAEDSSLEQKEWALQQGKQALALLSHDHSKLSYASLFIAHMLVVAFTCFLHDAWGLHAFRLMYEFDEHIQEQVKETSSPIPQTDRDEIVSHLQPIIARQKSKHAQLVDLIWCLKATEASFFDVGDRPSVPTEFTSVDHARSILDLILNWTTFAVKTTSVLPNAVPPEAENLMAIWLSALDTLQRSRNLPARDSSSHTQHGTHDVEVLRVCARVFFMMIKCMSSESEMIFDEYTDLYRDMHTVYKSVLTYRKSVSQSNFSISTEASLLTFVGNAACRWCRDPLIRKELIDLLYESKARELHESATAWAEVAQVLQTKEEESVYPRPRTAAEIPESARVRLDVVSLYMRSAIFSIRYIRYPFQQQSDAETDYIPFPGCGSYLDSPFKVADPDDKPDMSLGRGWWSWLKQPSSEGYYTVQQQRFYFNIPKV